VTKFFFWCYPWDLEEEGIEAAIDRMAGEIGVDAVSIATTLPSVSEFRARAFATHRTVEYDAAAHFQPVAKHYAGTRIRPIAAPWMKSRNPLEKIAQYAEKQGLKVRAWTTCCHGSAMVARHRMAACVNVFGDLSPSWMCPSNPDVREYVAALVEDLTTHYPLDTIELDGADFGGPTHSHKHARSGVGGGPVEQVLLSWCFCPSCQQRARDGGLDVEAVAAAAASQLGQMMLAKIPSHNDFDSLLASDANLAAYYKMRVEVVTSLARLIRGRTKARLVVHHETPTCFSAADAVALSEVCDGLVIPAPHQVRPQDPEPRLQYAWGVEKTQLAQPCHPPHIEDGPALVSTVHHAAQTGCAAIGFSNYGVAPEPCLDWVRQAVRYARRESM
jgi:hypothetical protein